MEKHAVSRLIERLRYVGYEEGECSRRPGGGLEVI